MGLREINKWSSEWTENVGACPLCDSDFVSKREADLIDWSSSPPSGYWQINICGSCGTGYLSPRPAIGYIQNAYKNYYTHSRQKDALIHQHIRNVQKYLYKNFCDHADHHHSLSSYTVYIMSRILFPLGMYFDAKSRHIFQLKSKGRLLDVGCGNGEFLEFADRYGWQATGVDFDQDAVRVVESGRVKIILGNIDSVKDKEGFDLITLNHVIEHVYDPENLIKSCVALLKKDGVLWVETPNIGSIGYQVYRSNWRGLEPPRHLVLFNKKSLINLLNKSGMSNVTQKCHAMSGIYMVLSSEKIKNNLILGDFPLRRVVMLLSSIVSIVVVEGMQLLSKRRREFLTFVARK